MEDDLRIGIDLGGTKIEGIVIKGELDNLTVLTRKRIPTVKPREVGAITDQVVHLIRELASAHELTPPFPVGIGMPGSVNRHGLVKNSNTVCLNNTPFRDNVMKQLDQPVQFANDANCFALAEATVGAAREYPVVFGVNLGTGVGGGIVVNGQMIEGRQSIGGEWGHMVLRPESDRHCYCGRRGCVETYLAGPAVEQHYTRLSGTPAPLERILTLRADGDPAAVQCVDTWLEHFGRGIANVINILDPDIIILGGGVSRADCLYTEGRQQVAQYVFNDELETPIIRHSLGDSAGVLGAVLLTYQITANGLEETP